MNTPQRLGKKNSVRFVCESTNHHVARHTFASAATAILYRLDDSPRQRNEVGVEATERDQAGVCEEFVGSGEPRKTRRASGLNSRTSAPLNCEIQGVNLGHNKLQSYPMIPYSLMWW